MAFEPGLSAIFVKSRVLPLSHSSPARISSLSKVDAGERAGLCSRLTTVLTASAAALTRWRRLRSTTQFRTLLINDASPDERIRPLLDRYALAHADTQVRHNAINRGFTWNVNQAFIAARATSISVCSIPTRW